MEYYSVIKGNQHQKKKKELTTDACNNMDECQNICWVNEALQNKKKKEYIHSVITHEVLEWAKLIYSGKKMRTVVASGWEAMRELSGIMGYSIFW